MGALGDAGRWSDGDLRREVFWFPSGGEDLFGSLYASHQPEGGPALLVCPTVGREFDPLIDLSHSIAARAAVGGCGLVFAPEGHGDSSGDPAASTISRLSASACDAALALRARTGAEATVLVGARLGAAVAVAAARRLGARRLVLIQPSFDADRYAWQTRMDFVPRGDEASETEAALHASLRDFEGARVIVRFSGRVREGVETGTPTIELPGRWTDLRWEVDRIWDVVAGWLRDGRGLPG